MITLNGLPVYAANVFDPETGIFKVAICDSPAIESGFQAFGKEKEILKYSIQDEEQRIVLGCLMRNSFPIYRRTADGFEYFIVYTKDTIEQMASKWLASQNVNNINLNHQEGTDQEGIYLMQAFIKDSAKGISPTGFDEIEDGSLFAQYKVMNDDVWGAIKEGTYVGFSLEGVFGVEPMEEEFKKQEQEENNNEKINKRFMSKLGKIKEMLQEIIVEVEYGSVTTDKGTLLWNGDDELKQGDDVWTITEENENKPVEDGDYVTEDGKTVVVVDSKVSEIKDNEAEVAPEETTEEEAQENAEEEPVEEPATEDETVDEKDALIDELKTRIAELEAENEELKAKVDELSQAPAAPNADEAFEAQQKNENRPLTKREKMVQKGYKFDYLK